MLPTFFAVLAFLSTVALSTGKAPTVHRLDDGGTFAIKSDSTFSLCYGTKCQIGDVVEIVDSLATLETSDCVDHSTTERTTCRGFDNFADLVYFGHENADSVYREEFKADSLVSVQDTFPTVSRIVAPPAAAPVQMVRLEVVAPERLTTCYVGISCAP